MFIHVLSCYLVVLFYDNQFSTDLTVLIPSKPISTLEQVLTSDKRPAFDTPTGLYKLLFENAPKGSIYQKIWTQTSPKNIYNGEDIVLMNRYFRRKYGNIALIGADEPMHLIRHICCVTDPQRYEIN